MSDWVRLDTEKLNTPKPQDIRGVNITVRMSPYDVPEAVRGYYDQALQRFVIEFRYIGDEPLKQEQQGEYITLRIGRHSGRLYGIEVDADAMKARAVSVNFENRLRVPQVSAAILKAIDTLSHHPQKRSRHENYEVAKDAITQKQDQIFASFATG
jgi:hypothetical protein